MCTIIYDNIAASFSECDRTTLWHKWLGHISLKGLELLKKEGILNDKIHKLDFVVNVLWASITEYIFLFPPPLIPLCLHAF